MARTVPASTPRCCPRSFVADEVSHEIAPEAPAGGADVSDAGSGWSPDFRRLWAALGTSNIADGITFSAGPLLVTSLTSDPFLVSLSVVMQFAPTLLFALLAGVVVDRVDRRGLQTVTHLLRAVVLVALVAMITTGVVTLWIVYCAVFLMGTAEAFADTANQTLVVATVPTEKLGVATSRLIATRTLANDLVGPPLGAFLFVAGRAWPFIVNALLLVTAAVLVSRLTVDGRGDRALAGSSAAAASAAGGVGVATRLRTDVAEGWRFVMDTPPVRRLAMLIAAFNLTFGAVQGVLVLWAFQRLGLDAGGFGLLLTATAIGGLAGAAMFGRLEQRFSYGSMLRVGLLVETFTHLSLALATRPWVAGLVLLVFGVHESVWGSLSGAIRLRLVPEQVLGRVNSVYRLAVFGPMVIGALLGGWIATTFGIVAPFIYAFVGAGLTTAWAWRSMDDLGAAGDVAAAGCVPRQPV
ncbi:MAG: MFS family permease [Nitriliruptoraceae bacterium]